MAAEFQCEAAAIPALLANVASISSGGGEPALTDTRRQRGPAAYDSRCTAGAGCDLSPEVAARPLGHQARSDVTGVTELRVTIIGFRRPNNAYRAS
jgi:hypothetical protein